MSLTLLCHPLLCWKLDCG